MNTQGHDRQVGDYYCRIERHSISPRDQELLSFIVTYPRSILPEWNTHTVISKNTSSSRAIPYSRKSNAPRKPTQPPSMREMVTENPYLPIFWGRNEAGMQAHSELFPEEIERCKKELLKLRDHTVNVCDGLWQIGMAKQDINRYLEAFGWTTQILTSCYWSNFFALRTHKDAHPSFRKMARWMYTLYKNSVPQRLDYGDWHLPFVDNQDYNEHKIEDLKKISVARSARLSYNTFDGIRDVKKDFELYDRLSSGTPKHMSPFGHQGTPQRNEYWSGNFYGWHQLRKDVLGENITQFTVPENELAAWINDVPMVAA